jgi:hypothetical protein
MRHDKYKPPYTSTTDVVTTIGSMLCGAIQPLFLVEGPSDVRHIGIAIATLGSALVASAVILRRAWNHTPRQVLKRTLRTAYLGALESCPLNPQRFTRSHDA